MYCTAVNVTYFSCLFMSNMSHIALFPAMDFACFIAHPPCAAGRHAYHEEEGSNNMSVDSNDMLYRYTVQYITVVHYVIIM